MTAEMYIVIAVIFAAIITIAYKIRNKLHEDADHGYEMHNIKNTNKHLDNLHNTYDIKVKNNNYNTDYADALDFDTSNKSENNE